MGAHYTPEQKFQIVKETITTNTPVSEICKKYNISTSVYYEWQKIFYSGALNEFKVPRNKEIEKIRKKERELQEENMKLKEVVAEFAQENLRLKKTFGV